MLNSIRIHNEEQSEDLSLRPEAITIFVNGEPTVAYLGETVATALLAAGIQSFRRSPSGAPRAPVCNMGVCFECTVTINGKQATRSCMTLVEPDMYIGTK